MKIVAIAILLAVLYFSTTPGDPSAPPETGISMGHVAGYFAIALTLLWSGTGERRALAFSLAYGILMELLQLNAPGRHFDAIDIVSNFIGSLFAVACNRFYKTKAKE